MSTLTPNYGLIVPEATDTVEQVRADYATNLGLIDNISGGGGGGGGNVYGAFVNTNDIIASGTYTGSFSYTATKDCYFYGEIANNSNTTATMTVDGKTIIQNYDSSISQNGCVVPLRKGQIIALTTTFAQAVTTYTVYGLIQGTESIFTPIIYSDNERMVGIWRDNKPLYQRTFTITLSNTADWTLVDDSVSYDKLVLAVGSFYEVGGVDDQVGQASTRSSLPRICVKTDHKLYYYASDLSAGRTFKYDVTVQYTKTTDVAGSGNWNTDGIPMVHYSTTEQVIGTYLGKPLYQKTISFNFTADQSNGTFWWCGNVDYTGLLPNDIERGWFVNGYYDTSGVHRNIMAGEIEINDHSILLFTNYSRTNVPAVATFQYTKTTD